MKKSAASFLVLFTLAGLICGFSLAALLMPGAASVQAAPQTVPPAAPAAVPADRSFTYQGLLRQAGRPVTATCDFQLALYDQLSAGTQLGSTQVIMGAAVVNGQFTLRANAAGQFGSSAFDGRAAWIDTAVRCPSNSGSFTPLSPRQALNAAPLAAGLAPFSVLRAENTNSGSAALSITAPAAALNTPLALEVSAGDRSALVGLFLPVAVWGNSGNGVGVWATTDGGVAVRADAALPTGQAGVFNGNVTINGNLNMPRFKTKQLINQTGPLPITSASFTTHGGTLLLFFSGSGYASPAPLLIGMDIKLDGTFVDSTGIYANTAATHLAFVSKQLVLTGIAAGTHTLSLSVMNAATQTDGGDIFTVSVLELPY